MKKRFLLRTIFAILVLPIVLCLQVRAASTWYIYSDTNIVGGEPYNYVHIYDTLPNHTTVNMYGGFFDVMYTHNESTLNVYGGRTEILAFDNSKINISSGILSGANAYDNGIVNFSGSSESRYLATSGGTVNMTGGIVDSLRAGDSGTIYLSGGLITDDISASSTINIYGHDLFKTASGGRFGNGLVWGYLTDNSYICVDLYNAEAYDHINLIPEPASMLLLSLGFLLVKQRAFGRYQRGS